MKIWSLFLLLGAVVFFPSQITISGKVTYRNKGVKDINVTLKGTYDGATTNQEGRYQFVTSETGDHLLTFSHPKYVEAERKISIDKENIVVDMVLKEAINEIEAVVISAGSIEASDKKRATALLTPIDIYTTAGSNGQITSALNFLPGTQKVGDSEGLFIRGGSGNETKIFMDGSLINNYFVSSVPGIAGRDRFNTSLFKGNIFSSGGYSALYGQALSGVLLLESVDLPEKSSIDIGISPIFINGGFQQLYKEKQTSFGATVGYSNLGLMQKLLHFNTDFYKAPESYNGDANFRIKTKKGGFIKYYTSLDGNAMEVRTPNLENASQTNSVKLRANNWYHNLSFKQKWGKYQLNLGGTYSQNNNDLSFSTFSGSTELPISQINDKGSYTNAKAVIERKLYKISSIRAGIEMNYAKETNNYNKNYKDLISSVFAETDLGFSNHLSAKIGTRVEHSSYLSKTNIAPRLALAYRFSKQWTSSFAYGIFYQNPESKYLNEKADLTFQESQHYILQLQRSSEGRSLRMEAFYKKYNQLEKTLSKPFYQTVINNQGNGFAKGFELFWRDQKTLPSIDYWISYSYLDTERNFLNYPISLTPSFASKHTLSLVAKKFIMKWKTGVNMSYTYAKGRPYYDIISHNGDNIIRNQGSLKDYNALNFSINYLPNIGKKEAKAFTVLVFSISNILGSKNVYGYNFSSNGTPSAVLPPVNSFVFVGAFISFGVDKTQNAINNNL